MSNREIKVILIGFSLILFISLYYNISKSTESTTADNIQAVVSLITLIVSIITIYFVYKAYQAQNEQIAIQQKELEENRKELEENKKDVEYNRTVDILFKQLDGTNKAFQEISQIYFDKLGNINSVSTIFEHIPRYNWILNVMIEHFTFFSRITNNDKFSINDKYILFDIIKQNINQDVMTILLRLVDKLILLDEGENREKFIEQLEKKFFRDKYFNVEMDDNDTDEEKRMLLIKVKYKDNIEEEIKLFDVVYEKTIDMAKLYSKVRRKE